ncbi:polynucleotide 3'-phosphatase ZDP isoform X2 [Dendrobium catenatum]|uniref:polynucleotide 3'-phosphatase ZDP isoform X2 n=1 Tax=Dendrobium catenatum TaxID=906689 RepID=UPI0010A0969D|nr:polynucleotide 3'-phosphatase ZDP isoform X2 [Dendrobium catenatum]
MHSRFIGNGEFLLRLDIPLVLSSSSSHSSKSQHLELVLLHIPASMAASKVLVEYAKSSRSSCKICSKNITAGSLRMGFSTKDPRGFDSVRWHHLNCYANSHPLGTVEEIKGFFSLKGSDQESLRKLVAEPTSSQSLDGDNMKEIEESHEMEVKKRKLLGAENKKNLEVKFSLSDVKNKYKDANLPPNWKAFNTIIFNEREEGLHDTEKIAAFDFDGCLANTSVKRIGADAWSLMYASIPEKLQELYNGGYKLVIFTNESNIERWKNKRQQAVDSKIGRLDSFIKLVKVPIQVFIACGLRNGKMESDDPFRKPMTGMWKIFTEHFNSGPFMLVMQLEEQTTIVMPTSNLLRR